MSFAYNSAKPLLSGVNWTEFDVRVLLVDPTYEASQNHQFVSDISGELTDGSYSRQAVLGRSVTVDTVDNLAVYIADNPMWVTLNGAEHVVRAIFFQNVTDDSDSVLLFCLDLPDFVTDGGDYTIKLNGQSSSGPVFVTQDAP